MEPEDSTVYSYSTTNKKQLLSSIIYSCKTLYMFRAVKVNSSPTAACSSSCLTYIIAVYAVLSFWWWTERPPEIYRAFYKNISFEITDASCWLYYGNMLRCTNLRILKNQFCVYNKCVTTGLYPCHMNPLPTILYFLQVHCNVILPFTSSPSKWFLSFRSPHQNPMCIFNLPHTLPISSSLISPH
jgi:hypothetical protein